MTLNSSDVNLGVCDIARVLQVSSTTVLAVLEEAAAKTHHHNNTTARASTHFVIRSRWTVEFRAKQGATMRAAVWFEPTHAYIPPFVLGRRTDANGRKLYRKIANWRPVTCESFLPTTGPVMPKCSPEYHHVGKKGTQRIERIERKNLNFRTHLKRWQRKTICFSKSLEIHEALIKLYVHALNSNQQHFEPAAFPKHDPLLLDVHQDGRGVQKHCVLQWKRASRSWLHSKLREIDPQGLEGIEDTNEKGHFPLRENGLMNCGDRIRTCDLKVMSLASYRAAPPRDMN